MTTSAIPVPSFQHFDMAALDTTIELPETDSLGIHLTAHNLIDAINQGFPYEALSVFMRKIELAQNLLFQYLRIASSTAARRRKEGRLSTLESDRLYRFAHIYELTKAMMLGDASAARQWLQEPKAILNDKTPWEYASTEAGAKDVERYINRIMDGVYC